MQPCIAWLVQTQQHLLDAHRLPLVVLLCASRLFLAPAGEGGVGKSTFIHNLVSGFKVTQPGSEDKEGATTMKQFKADPNSLLTVLAPLDATDSNQRLHITVQVTD
jgi:ABC-type thiamine transport system ATPase subunit